MTKYKVIYDCGICNPDDDEFFDSLEESEMHAYSPINANRVNCIRSVEVDEDN